MVTKNRRACKTTYEIGAIIHLSKVDMKPSYEKNLLDKGEVEVNNLKKILGCK
ncbi:MAG: hypothetical protein AABY22_36690 [Nanoarchaeota archaeon]